MANTILANATPGIYDDLVNGTCELPQTYGTVISGELEQPEDLDKIKGCNGNVSAILLRDDETTYSASILIGAGALPERGDPITFPTDFGTLVGILTMRKVTWAQGAQKILAIKASHWTAIGNSPTTTTVA